MTDAAEKPPRKRTTAKKLERAAEIARKTGQAVTVGDFTVHPPGGAAAGEDEGSRVQKKLDRLARGGR